MKKFEFIRLKLCEVNMIDDPDEAEHYVFEEIDPDLISYTYSVRGWDQLIKKDFNVLLYYIIWSTFIANNE